MNVQDAIKNRRTIHSFNTKLVPEIIIERAIEAANYAPCHLHTFPWRFISIKQEKRQLLANEALDLKFQNHSLDAITKEKVLKKFLNPSHLIIASQVLNADAKRELEDYAACACAIQNLSLSLVGDGVGSKWSTGKITSTQQTYKIIGIDPNQEKIIGFIWIGYGELPPKIKRPLVTSIFWEW